MGAFLFVALLFWVLPIVVGQIIGGRKNRQGWAYGFLLGWLGVIIVAFRDTKREPVQQVTHVHVATPAAVVTSRMSTEPATIALPGLTPAATPPPPVLPPAGWYGDPDGNGSLRWWDGTTWTDFRAPSTSAPGPNVAASA